MSPARHSVLSGEEVIMPTFVLVFCTFCGKYLARIIADKEPLAICEGCEKEHAKELANAKPRLMK